jgi:hypothetical protein
MERAAEQYRSLSHAGEAARLADRKNTCRIEADPVIFYLDRQLFGERKNTYHGIRRSRMACDIRQAFLNDPKRGSLQFRPEPSILESLVFEIDTYTGLRCVMTQMPVEGRQQTEVIERSRPQIERQFPRPRYQFVDERLYFIELTARIGRAGSDKHLELEF